MTPEAGHTWDLVVATLADMNDVAVCYVQDVPEMMARAETESDALELMLDAIRSIVYH